MPLELIPNCVPYMQLCTRLHGIEIDKCKAYQHNRYKACWSAFPESRFRGFMRGGRTPERLMGRLQGFYQNLLPCSIRTQTTSGSCVLRPWKAFQATTEDRPSNIPHQFHVGILVKNGRRRRPRRQTTRRYSLKPTISTQRPYLPSWAKRGMPHTKIWTTHISTKILTIRER